MIVTMKIHKIDRFTYRKYTLIAKIFKIKLMSKYHETCSSTADFSILKLHANVDFNQFLSREHGY